MRRGRRSRWCGTTPRGDKRRCGSASATRRGNTVQKPWVQNSSISSQTKSTACLADLWEPRDAAACNRAIVQGPVWSGTLAPRFRMWLSSRAAARGSDATLSGMSARPRSPRTNCVQSPISSNFNAVSSAYLRKDCSARVELGPTRAHVGGCMAPSSPGHGGAPRSRGAGAVAASAPWPPRQGPAAAGGAEAVVR